MRTIIQEHSSALISGLLTKVNSLKRVNHKVTKGQLKELFISDILDQFLPYLEKTAKMTTSRRSKMTTPSPD